MDDSKIVKSSNKNSINWHVVGLWISLAGFPLTAVGTVFTIWSFIVPNIVSPEFSAKPDVSGQVWGQIDENLANLILIKDANGLKELLRREIHLIESENIPLQQFDSRCKREECRYICDDTECGNACFSYSNLLLKVKKGVDANQRSSEYDALKSMCLKLRVGISVDGGRARPDVVIAIISAKSEKIKNLADIESKLTSVDYIKDKNVFIASTNARFPSDFIVTSSKEIAEIAVSFPINVIIEMKRYYGEIVRNPVLKKRVDLRVQVFVRYSWGSEFENKDTVELSVDRDLEEFNGIKYMGLQRVLDNWKLIQRRDIEQYMNLPMSCIK